MLLTSPNVVGFLNMPPKVFTNLFIYLFFFWAITYCVLLTHFIVFNRCKKSIYVVICKYDLEKPFSIMNKSENNNNNNVILL